MKIASFNVNGIRARMPIILDWIRKETPDVLCLQETKVQDPDFPLEPIKAAGYHCSFKGQKSYNGVATLTRLIPDNIAYGFGDGDPLEEPRLITIGIAGLTIVNTYIPQGRDPRDEAFQYKLEWFSRLKAFFETMHSPDQPLVWTGDFNVAPEPIDVHDPEGLKGSVGFHPDEQAALARVMDWGFVDVYRKHRSGEQAYTFFDYRIPNGVKRGLGWRIDHICATRPLADASVDARIDLEPRLMQRPSDHTLIIAEFNWPP